MLNITDAKKLELINKHLHEIIEDNKEWYLNFGNIVIDEDGMLDHLSCYSFGDKEITDTLIKFKFDNGHKQ